MATGQGRLVDQGRNEEGLEKGKRELIHGVNYVGMGDWEFFLPLSIF
jgi:hypothetical protein